MRTRASADKELEHDNGAGAYIVDMMTELARLASESGDSAGTLIIEECANVLRRQNALRTILRQAEAT